MDVWKKGVDNNMNGNFSGHKKNLNVWISNDRNCVVNKYNQIYKHKYAKNNLK